MFEKCKNLVYMNEYGIECKNNISAYGFWPSQLYDTLSMNFYYGRWKACIKHDVFTSANPHVLNCSEVTYMGYKA